MSSQKKYPVALSAEDREALVRMTMTGVRSASMIRRARVLLALDTSVGGVDPRAVIADRVGVSCETVRLVSKRFAETDGDVWATVGAEPAPGNAGAAKEAIQINSRAAGWAYKVPAFKGQQFMTTLDSLLKPLASPATTTP